MTQWRVLVPIGIAVALWAVLAFRPHVPANLLQSAPASGPCRPTAAEMAATEAAITAYPTTMPTPTPVSYPVVTTELVILAGDQDIPTLSPSLIIRAPKANQPDINALLDTTLTQVDVEAQSTTVPFPERERHNSYRNLLRDLLLNDVSDPDDFGVLAGDQDVKVFQDALDLREPPTIGVAKSGTVTLVIPQGNKVLANNETSFAGGWTITSDKRNITFRFQGQPDTKIGWDVRVCSDGLPIVSAALATRTPIAGTTPTPLPFMAPWRSPATPAAPLLVSQSASEVHWWFPNNAEPADIEVIAEAPPLAALRIWLSSEGREVFAAILAYILPVGLLVAALLMVPRATDAKNGLKEARARLEATTWAVVRIAVAAGLSLLIYADVTVRFADSDPKTASVPTPASVPGPSTQAAAPPPLATSLVAPGPGANRVVDLVSAAQRWMQSQRDLYFWPVIFAIAITELGFMGFARQQTKGERPSSWEIALILGFVVVLLGCFAYLAQSNQVGRFVFPTIRPALLVAGYTMFLVTAFSLWYQRVRGKAVTAQRFALPLFGAVSLFLCLARLEVEFYRGWNKAIAGGLIPLWVTCCAFVGFVLVAAALLTDLRSQATAERSPPIHIRPSHWVVVAALIVVILGQWEWSVYSQENIWWRALVESDPITYFPDLASVRLADSLEFYPTAFSVAVFELLVLLGLAGIAGVLHAAGKPSSAQELKTPFLREDQRWIRRLLIGLFAAFVIGYGGQVLGVRAPVAFLLGLVLLPLVLSNKANEESQRINTYNARRRSGEFLVMTHRGNLLQRALALVGVDQQLARNYKNFTDGTTSAKEFNTKQAGYRRDREALLLGTTTGESATGESAAAESATAESATRTEAKAPVAIYNGGKSVVKLKATDAPAALALSLGPEDGWWENGTLAVRLGGLLAIVPIAYFIYVYLTSPTVGGWSLRNPFAIVGLVSALTFEIAFWMVAAFVLGCLFPYLFWHNGPVKGMMLALVYVGANAAAALLGIPGNALWQVRSFQLLLFLILLGAWLDLKTVEKHGLHQRDLIALYELPKTTGLVSQVLPLVTALAAVVVQLLLGQTQEATSSLISGEASSAIFSAICRGNVC